MSDLLQRIAKLSPERLKMLAIDLHDRLERAEAERREPLAVVGIGCRLPGGVEGPDGFWNLLRDGVDAIGEVPPDRWDIDEYYDPDPDVPDKMATRWGGFLTDIDRFDPDFFGISPREAESMDPQQRLLLEVTWEALEHAGLSADSLKGSLTGVYIGITSSDYLTMQTLSGGHAPDAYLATGGSNSVASGRLSYILGLQGPAVSLDTACSSSLIAVHLACRALRGGECQVALAGGVNLIMWPDVSVSLSRGHMMAPDGRCKTFDARADGFVRGEGAGMVVLKRLSDAVADGDRVLALVRGTASNQDGRSNGLTAPNGLAQQAVIRGALDDAGVAPSRVGYVETHGTGTVLGDPIEVQALGTVLREGRNLSDPVVLGSAKTNLGHLEATAGVTGLIKAVLCLHHQQIPPHLHFESPNPHIDWASYPVRVGVELADWPAGAEPRVAAVSSFGFSGSNAHVVLEEAPPAPEPSASHVRPIHVLPLSARTPDALRALAGRYAEHLESADTSWPAVCATAGAGRVHHDHRTSVVAATASEALARLSDFHAGVGDVEYLSGRRTSADGPEIAFLFSGQGSQYQQMGRQLYDTHPTFRHVIDHCDELSQDLLDRSLKSVLFSHDGSDAIHETVYTQPATFALQVALARLWGEWGIEPTALLGHSLGEFAAACVAGVFSLEDGFRLIAERGRLTNDLPGQGAMAAIFTPRDEVDEAIAHLLSAEGFEGRIAVAAVNGPAQTVVSGDVDVVEALLLRFEASDVETRRLEVSHAFHSPLVEPVLDDLRRTAAGIPCSPPRMDLVSSVTGLSIGEEICRADYWTEQARRPVEFARAMETLRGKGCKYFLEIGPHTTLVGLAAQTDPEAEAYWLASLRRGHDEWEQISESLARLYAYGSPVDWKAFNAPYGGGRATLPTYPFQRERYWFKEGKRWAPAGARSGSGRGHPLLRAGLDTARRERLYEAEISLEALPFLGDHRIGGVVVLPAPAYIEMALVAGSGSSGRVASVEDFAIHRPLTLGDDESVRLQMIRDADGAVEIFRAVDDGDAMPEWMLLAGGRVAGHPAEAPPNAEELDEVRRRCTDEMTGRELYGRLEERGVQFGPSFQGVRSLRRRDGEALALVRQPEESDAGDGFELHPALLDACFHTLGAALPGGGTQEHAGDTYLMTGLERLTRFGPLTGEFHCHATIRPTDLERSEMLIGDLRVTDPGGTVLVEAVGLRMKRARPGALTQGAVDRWLYEVSWVARDLGAASTGPSALRLPAALARSVEEGLGELRTRDDLRQYTGLVSGLDRLATSYVVAAFAELGWSLAAGVRISAPDVVSTAGVPLKHHRLVRRLLQMLGEDGVLSRDGDGWLVASDAPTPDPAQQERALRETYPDFPSEIDLLTECGTRLADVLRGIQDPLQILFPGGSMSRVEGLTERSPMAQSYNVLATRVVEDIVAASPDDARIRVLEVGAGTGGTSASIVPALPAERTEYVFTDVAQLFLTTAAEKFVDHSFIRFRLLDLEKPPAEQGFGGESFDLIVASHVVHATRDIAKSLDHLRSLLAPGGVLLLLEGRGPMRWVDLTFGLTEGWWRFTDEELRPSHPLLGTEAWGEALDASGFTEVSAQPGVGVELAWPAVIVARRPDRAAEAEGARAASDRWLLVGGPEETASALSRAWEESGTECEVLAAGTDARGAAALRARVKELMAPDASNGPWRGVLHLAALGRPTMPDAPVEDVDAAIEGVCYTALAVVQGIADAELKDPPRLWLVSRGAQPGGEGDGPIDAAQATLWGFGRNVAMEHPEFWGGLIDLDPAGGDDDVVAVVPELTSAVGEQVCHRGGRRYVARLGRASRPSSSPPEFSPDASYLVTGGLGGIGLAVARWTVESGARHLTLMQRSEASETALGVVEELRAAGAEVRIEAGDVAQVDDVTRVLASIDTSGAPLRGVFHTAGVFDDRVLTRLDWDRFARVLAPKVRGGWILHRLTRDRDLDFFVLFSSAASFLAPVGLGNYAAANAFTDALAEHRRRVGLPAVSVSWGPWEGTGMADAVGPGRRSQWSQVGFGTIPINDALDVLGRVVQGGDEPGSAHVAVLPGEWTDYYRSLVPYPPIFHDLPSSSDAASPTGPTAPEAGGTFVQRLADVPAEDRFDALVSWITDQVRSVLGFRQPQVLDPARGFFDLGMDSLTAVELKNRLQEGLETPIASTLVFDYATVDDLADQLRGELGLGDGDAHALGSGDVTEGHEVDATDAMSEAEIAAALAEKLRELE